MSEAFDEFAIEWTKSSKKATVTAPTNTSFKTKIKKLAEKYPDEVDYVENKDGSICGHVPVKYVKIYRPREVSEEQKEAARLRMEQWRDLQKS